MDYISIYPGTGMAGQEVQNLGLYLYLSRYRYGRTGGTEPWIISLSIQVQVWQDRSYRTLDYISIYPGTGMAGQELQKLGFKNIHASDMSCEIL